MKKLLSTLLMTTTLETITSFPAKAEWNAQTFNDVVQNLDAFWNSVLTEVDIPYQSPTVNVYAEVEPTPCGLSTYASYCPTSNTVHLNLSAMSNLANIVGDSAPYVALAHEYAHSIQNQLGLFPDQSSNPQKELQADCLAGIFFASAHYAGRLEPGDLEEGIFSSYLHGDDGVGEPGHHGTPMQRATAFAGGLSDPEYCFKTQTHESNYAFLAGDLR